MNRRRGLLYITGALLLVVPSFLWVLTTFAPRASGERTTNSRGVRLVQDVSSAKPVDASLEPLRELAEQDPMALVRLGIERYREEVDSYRCTFIKQELLPDGLSEEQVIEVRYREEPHTVYMIWKENADSARRGLYVDHPDFVDDEGRKLGRFEPNGAVARLFVKDIMLPVDGPRARKASRRSINEFGFMSTYNLLYTYNEAAERRGVLDLKYSGTGVIDGRPTFVITRNLPYASDPDGFPDARMVLHIDQAWLLPVAVYSYADQQERELLGSYVYADVELNPDFTDEDFAF